MKSLPPEAKKRYIDKLICLGFDNVEENDPYIGDSIKLKTSKKKHANASPLWVDDNSKWPSVEFGSIYCIWWTIQDHLQGIICELTNPLTLTLCTQVSVCICGRDERHGSMMTCDSEYCCVWVCL